MPSFQGVKRMGLADFAATVDEQFPDVSLQTAVELVSFLCENRAAFAMPRKVSVTSAWITLLEDALVEWTRLARGVADELGFDPSGEDDGDEDGRPPKRRKKRAVAGKLLSLARSLGIVEAAEEQLNGQDPVEQQPRSSPLLLLPAYRFCGAPSCGGRELLRGSQVAQHAVNGRAIVGGACHPNVAEVRGRCPSCRSTFFHDRIEVPLVAATEDERSKDKIVHFLNAAKTLKLAEGLFVDRRFARNLLNQIAFSRASFSSFSRIISADLFEEDRVGAGRDLHAWRCFLHHTIREMARERGRTFAVVDWANEEELAWAAWEQLADNGVLPGTDDHICEGCEVIGDPPAEPEPEEEEGEGPDLGVLEGTSVFPPRRGSTRVVVTDAIAMGPLICAARECPSPRAPAEQGTSGEDFCYVHLHLATLCRVVDCGQPRKDVDSFLCAEHEDLEEVYVRGRERRKTKTFATAERARRRAKPDPFAPPDEEADASEPRWTTPHFGPKRSDVFIIVTYACGLIRRCGRLPLREGAEEIVDFLDGAFDGQTKPGYIASDKACLLLKYLCSDETKTGDAEGRTRWERDWRDSSRFIVDDLHSRSHPDDDPICKRFCRPEILEAECANRDQKPNTMIAEHINAHLGAYQYFAGSMTCANFDWFMFVVVWLWNRHKFGPNPDPTTE